MVINTPTFNKVNDNYKIEFIINSTKFKNTLWYELDERYKDFVSDSCDAALIALLIPAMDEGEDIHINGHIAEELYSNIFKLQKILQIIIPSLQIIKVTANELKNYNYNSKYVATGFSAGIDSFSTLYDYYYNCKIDNKKITHFTYHNVGSHNIGEIGITDQSISLFNKRFELANDIASKLDSSGIPFIKINSNLDEFYVKSYLYFMQTHTLRNMSVALLLSKGLKTYYYSSGYHYSNVHIAASYDISISDPVILPLLSTNNLNLEVAGSEYTRVEKTINVSKLDDAKKCLDVCVQSTDGTNCSKCSKCMRTQYTLELSGELENFKNVFDLNIYKKEKPKYILTLLKDNHPLANEIIDYAKTKNYKFPLAWVFYGNTIKFLKKIKKIIKEFK